MTRTRLDSDRTETTGYGWVGWLRLDSQGRPAIKGPGSLKSAPPAWRFSTSLAPRNAFKCRAGRWACDQGVSIVEIHACLVAFFNEPDPLNHSENADDADLHGNGRIGLGWDATLAAPSFTRRQPRDVGCVAERSIPASSISCRCSPPRLRGAPRLRVKCRCRSVAVPASSQPPAPPREPDRPGRPVRRSQTCSSLDSLRSLGMTVQPDGGSDASAVSGRFRRIRLRSVLPLSGRHDQLRSTPRPRPAYRGRPPPPTADPEPT
jgi:hypothetical protein